MVFGKYYLTVEKSENNIMQAGRISGKIKESLKKNKEDRKGKR